MTVNDRLAPPAQPQVTSAPRVPVPAVPAQPVSLQPVSFQGTRPQVSAPNLQRTSTGRPGRPSGEDRPGWAWLLLVTPLLCCGGPLLLGVAAAAGAAKLGLVVGVPVALLVLGATAVWMRRRARGSHCCDTDTASRFR